MNQDIKTMNEQEMRDSKVPTLGSLEEVTAYIRDLVERQHDYGTCCYAMSMSAVAAFNYVASQLGVTGFQASCADMDILARTRSWKWGKLLNYENLLYPQYCNSEHFPDSSSLIHEHRVELAKRAEQLLGEKKEYAHPNVVAHWEMLVRNGGDQVSNPSIVSTHTESQP